jgi:hypothetical protein
VLGALLFKIRKNLHDDRWQRALGFIYTCYRFAVSLCFSLWLCFLSVGIRPQTYFWEVVVLLRRASMIVLSLVFISEIRAFLLAMASFFFLLLQFAVMPNTLLLENVVETAVLALLTFIAVIEASRLSTTNPFSVSVLTGAAFVLGVVLIVGGVVYVWRERVLHLVDRIRVACGGRPREPSSPEKSALDAPLLEVASVGYDRQDPLL